MVLVKYEFEYRGKRFHLNFSYFKFSDSYLTERISDYWFEKSVASPVFLFGILMQDIDVLVTEN